MNDPRFVRIVRCQSCGQPAAYDPAAELCARCALRRHVDDGDHAAAYAVAAECDIPASEVRRAIRAELDRQARAQRPTRRTPPGGMAVVLPRPSLLPGESLDRAMPVPTRVPCGEPGWSPERPTIRPPGGVAARAAKALAICLGANDSGPEAA